MAAELPALLLSARVLAIDINHRAPEVGAQQPETWINSRRALRMQAVVEEQQPQRAHRVRRGLITACWARELDRIPCMLAPTGARHLGLQHRLAEEDFVLGALRDRPDGDGCR